MPVWPNMASEPVERATGQTLSDKVLFFDKVGIRMVARCRPLKIWKKVSEMRKKRISEITRANSATPNI